MLCKYKEIFGKVGEGIHSYRFLNIAIMDVLFTIIGAFIIKLFIPNYNIIFILLFLFLLGIFLHHIFCVRTTIDKLLFN
jgi:uncharacterized membrane protein